MRPGRSCRHRLDESNLRTAPPFIHRMHGCRLEGTVPESSGSVPGANWPATLSLLAKFNPVLITVRSRPSKVPSVPIGSRCRHPRARCATQLAADGRASGLRPAAAPTEVTADMNRPMAPEGSATAVSLERLYRMPTVFGPAPGLRNVPHERQQSGGQFTFSNSAARSLPLEWLRSGRA